MTYQRVVSNNRVERIFFLIRANENDQDYNCHDQNVQEQDQNGLNKQNQSFDDFSNVYSDFMNLEKLFESEIHSVFTVFCAYLNTLRLD